MYCRQCFLFYFLEVTSQIPGSVSLRSQKLGSSVNKELPTIFRYFQKWLLKNVLQLFLHFYPCQHHNFPLIFSLFSKWALSVLYAIEKFCAQRRMSAHIFLLLSLKEALTVLGRYSVFTDARSICITTQCEDERKEEQHEAFGSYWVIW